MAGTFVIGGDMEVRRLGFGAMRLTGEGIWGEPKDPEEARRVLHKVLDLGVNFIDTADSYGPYVSERLIAEALYPYPDDLVIATKGGLERPAAGQWVTNGHPEHLKKACLGSLERLRVDTIDLYQLHAVDDDVPLEESLGMLAELKKEGRIRHIGVSNFNEQELARAQEVTEIVSLQNRYNIMERKYDHLVDICNENNIAFIPFFPLATGDIAERQDFSNLAEQLDASPMQVALAWLLHRAENILPIPGTSSVEHLEENTAARDIRLSPEDFERLTEAA